MPNAGGSASMQPLGLHPLRTASSGRTSTRDSTGLVYSFFSRMERDSFRREPCDTVLSAPFSTADRTHHAPAAFPNVRRVILPQQFQGMQ